jgi:uncharacterized protein (DUF2236 family)
MTVDRAELERLIAEVRAEVRTPSVGIYGPESQAWTISKEGVLFLGGGRAALLQLAHPFVAHAVDQHSATREDPLGRFQRTFDHVFAMVFGDLEHAIQSARRVHAVHTRIRGRIDEAIGGLGAGAPYEANDEAALLWVHATLIHTAVEMYERYVRPLSTSEKDRYWQETRRFARLFGLSDAVLPASWVAFDAYWQRMIEGPELAVGRPALELRGFLFRAPRRVRSLFQWLELMTAGLMPSRLREEFRFAWGPRERLAFAASDRALRLAVPRLPARLRELPAYSRARRRLSGAPERDLWDDRLERWAFAAIGGGRAEARRARVRPASP